MTDGRKSLWRGLSAGWAVALLLGPVMQAHAQVLRPATELKRPAASPATRTVDYIVALVNSEPVTNFDVRQRLLRLEQQASSQGRALPPRDELVKQVLEQLVVERALIQQATEQGVRVDEAALVQAEQGIAAQNQLTVEEFRRRVVAEGLDPNKIRNELRNQLLLQRLREREVNARVNVSEAEIDAFIRERQSASADALELNLGHVLIQLPENAGEDRVRELQAVAQGVAQRLRSGADLAEQAKAFSQGPEAASGGLMGLRPTSRLPELFVQAVSSLPVGGVAGPLRSAAGFHVLKVVERRQAPVPELSVVPEPSQAHSAAPGAPAQPGTGGGPPGGVPPCGSACRLGRPSFEDLALAKEYSQDGSARKMAAIWAGCQSRASSCRNSKKCHEQRSRPGEISQSPGVALRRAPDPGWIERRESKMSQREQMARWRATSCARTQARRRSERLDRRSALSRLCRVPGRAAAVIAMPRSVA